MKIITIIGARPQFIKAAVVSHAFNEVGTDIQELIVHTGQHFDANMSEIFFNELGIPIPKHQLNVGGGTHGQNTGRMIEKIEEVLLQEKPDWVLVYGDTDSTLAGAIAAVKIHIPVAHVEAGLRSFNRRMPEEVNRVLTDHAADLLFTPTESATKHLLEKEGIPEAKVVQVGDVMFDAAIHYGGIAEKNSNILEELALSNKAFVLATIHRAENTDDRERFRQILAGLSASDHTVVWPIHPRARKRMAEFELVVPKSVRLIEPVGYLDMVMLLKSASLVATDSGGVQKEAYFHGTPCITMRDETEWKELITMGVNRLVGADSQKITDAILKTSPSLPNLSSSIRPYGDGQASHKIAQSLLAS